MHLITYIELATRKVRSRHSRQSRWHRAGLSCSTRHVDMGGRKVQVSANSMMGVVWLDSQQLHSGSDDRSLPWADLNGVTVVGFEPSRTLARIEQPAVPALALFPQQLWVLDEHGTHVSRFHSDGRLLGSKRRLTDASCSGWLVPTVGVPAVLVEGDGRQLLVEHVEQLVEVPVPSRSVAFPRSGRRHVICQNGYGPFRQRCHHGSLAGVKPLGGAALFGSDKRVVLLVNNEQGHTARSCSSRCSRAMARRASRSGKGWVTCYERTYP